MSALLVIPVRASRMTVCDWPQCQRMASFHVRRDVPRGDSFTSLMWVRCGDHVPGEQS